jgi:aminopeptidase N
MNFIKQITAIAFVMLAIYSFGQGSHECSRTKSANTLSHRSARLSNHYINLTEEYDVHFYKLDISLEKTSTDIACSTEIHVVTKTADLDTFLFELFDDLIIDEVLLNGTLSVPFSREESAVIVPVDFELGDSFFMKVIYHGTPPDGDGPLGGGGMTNDFSPSWGNYVTWSLSEPFAAYEWFACKQSLTDKADSVHVFVTTDEVNKVGSNGLLTNVVSVPGGKNRYEWKSNYPIVYYLISVAVAEYVDYSIYAEPSGAPEPILVQNYIYNNPACLPYFEDDINETVDFIELYSEHYGLYPFANEKYGHCMAPIGGGMEHQTMTTQGYFTPWLTAHELGHQWFGDNVTCASWSDIWLNEGFASYSEELMYEAFYPGNEVVSMNDRHDNIKSEPGGAVWVEDSLTSSRIFNGRLSYDKGAAIIHTMRFMLDNDAVFFEILQTYQEYFKDSSARAIDFKNILEDVSGLDFTNYFNEWYYGEGFPTYSSRYAKIDDQLIFVLDQTSSMPGVTPLFTNDVEVKVTGEDGAVEIFRLTAIDAASSTHFLDFSQEVTSITIDPNNWIINNNGPNVEDLELLSLMENSQEFSVFPNPATDYIKVPLDQVGDTYLIIDAAGRVGQTGILFPNTTNKIDVSTLSKGQYILQIGNNKANFVKK